MHERDIAGLVGNGADAAPLAEGDAPRLPTHPECLGEPPVLQLEDLDDPGVRDRDVGLRVVWSDPYAEPAGLERDLRGELTREQIDLIQITGLVAT